MRRLKVIGVCLGAAFALNVMTGSALALPEFSGPFPKAFTSISKATLLETASKNKVKCTADTATGSITGATTASITITFTGCAEGAAAVPCQTPGRPPGEIVTFGLFGQLGYIELEPEKQVGLDLSDPAAGVIMNFECGAGGQVITGSVIGKVTPLNKLTKKLTVKFVQKKSVQTPTKLLGEPVDILMNTNPEPVGLASAEPLSFAAPVFVTA
jgi:hypothetical protein